MDETDVRELFTEALSTPAADTLDVDAAVRWGTRRRTARRAATVAAAACVLALVAGLLYAARPQAAAPIETGPTTSAAAVPCPEQAPAPDTTVAAVLAAHVVSTRVCAYPPTEALGSTALVVPGIALRTALTRLAQDAATDRMSGSCRGTDRELRLTFTTADGTQSTLGVVSTPCASVVDASGASRYLGVGGAWDAEELAHRLLAPHTPPAGSGSLVGRIVMGGGPPPGVVIPVAGTVTVLGDGVDLQVTTDQSGWYAVDVPPGRYHVTARSNQFNGGTSDCFIARAGVVVREGVVVQSDPDCPMG